MEKTPKVVCVGSVLWDFVGHAHDAMDHGDDVAGRILRLPGGVAMNIAMALAAHRIEVALLSAVGADREGDELLRAAAEMGLETRHVRRMPAHPTDRYMAIESRGAVMAAIADAHTLEAAGMAIFDPIAKGDLARDGVVAIDGNLKQEVLTTVAASDLLAEADLRVAPASPGKAGRIAAFLGHRGATLYVNLSEADTLGGGKNGGAAQAARVLAARGGARVLVTDGPNGAAFAGRDGFHQATPPEVEVSRVTGAGDALMAAHIAAELDGADEAGALARAVERAARYVAGEDAP